MSIVENLEKMLKSGQDNAMLRFGLGSAYFNEKRFAEAAPHLRACLAQDSGYTAAYKLLGKALFKLDELDEARDVFARGLPVSIEKGDKQTQREIEAFQKKLDQR